MRTAGSYEPGKTREALWIASAYPEEVECDLQRYYGLDFVDLFRPGTSLTWRKLLVLLHHLPPESALNTAMRNDAPEAELAKGSAKSDPALGSWSAMESMMASLIDEVRLNTWVYIQAHSEQSVQKPEPIRRPGVTGRRGKLMPLADAARIDPRMRGMSEEQAQEFMDRVTGRGR